MQPNLVGQKISPITFITRALNSENKYDWKQVSTDELFSGKRVVIFALPGAFTPTCSGTHLPGYDLQYEEIIKTGVDEVYCLSVNDSFVMNAWAKNLDVKNVKMLPDGNAESTKSLGMLVEKTNLGFGMRSWRYSIVVQDGVIEQAFIEPGFGHNVGNDPFEVSDANTMLTYLQK